MSDSNQSIEYQPLPLESGEALRELLEAHDFDTAAWGDGPTKTVEALWHELEEGESVIMAIDGELVRRTNVAAVNVVVRFDDENYRLYEEKQVFANGSERRRNLVTSLAEKIKLDELPEQAVIRAINEELGISLPKIVRCLGERVLERVSQTFGGISTQLMLRLAEVELYASDFDPNGYIEYQKDKSVHFKWRKLDDPIIVGISDANDTKTAL